MKIGNVPGEFGFRALVKEDAGWLFNPRVFFTAEEAKEWFDKFPGTLYKWPVEVYEDGSIYVPDPSELE